jgi:hypothetical protein
VSSPLSRRRACTRQAWRPLPGRRGSPKGRNCSGPACGRQARGQAPGGSGPALPAVSGAPARIACQHATKTGVSRSSSAHSESSLLAAGSRRAATVAAMRNLAGRRFSATSRYHDSAPRIAGSSQILRLPRSLMINSNPATDMVSLNSLRSCRVQSLRYGSASFEDLSTRDLAVVAGVPDRLGHPHPRTFRGNDW